LWSMTGDSLYESKALGVLRCYGKDLSAQPFGYCSMIGSVMSQMKCGMESIVIVGENDAELQKILRRLRLGRRNPNSTIVKLDKESMEYFGKHNHTVYSEVYKQFGDLPHVKVLVCKDRSCQDFNDFD